MNQPAQVCKWPTELVQAALTDPQVALPILADWLEDHGSDVKLLRALTGRNVSKLGLECLLVQMLNLKQVALNLAQAGLYTANCRSCSNCSELI